MKHLLLSLTLIISANAWADELTCHFSEWPGDRWKTWTTWTLEDFTEANEGNIQSIAGVKPETRKHYDGDGDAFYEIFYDEQPFWWKANRIGKDRETGKAILSEIRFYASGGILQNYNSISGKTDVVISFHHGTNYGVEESMGYIDGYGNYFCYLSYK